MRDAIDMAREAGIELDLIDEDEGQIWYITTEGMKAFEALVRADERDLAMRENAYVQAEREACWRLCDALWIERAKTRMTAEKPSEQGGTHDL